MYDDLVGTFTKNGYVDEQSQKNDLAIVAQVADVNDVILTNAPTISASPSKLSSS